MIKRILKEIVPSDVKERIKSLLIHGLGENVVSNNMFERLEVLKNLGYLPNIIIDVGAYKGNWTSRAVEIFPDSKFIMLEAQPDKEEFLKSITQKYHKTEYQITLLGATNTQAVQFYKMETGSSIYSEQSDAKREIITLGMKTLDSVAPELNPQDKVFLKLDVQGAEIDVLNGANRVWDNIDFILLEASVLNYNKYAPLVGDIFKFLGEKGFILFDICEQKRTANKVLMQVDLLFTKLNSKIRIENNF